jgi:transcriptional regulator with XRE-family HTH domain
LDIGAKIRDLRLASDLTQEELAERADLTKGFISQLERDRTSISLDSFLDILAALNVTINEFFSAESIQIVFTQDDRAQIEEKGVHSFSLLIPGATNRRMEPALVTLKGGEKTTTIGPFQGEEFGLVIQGRIAIHFGNMTHKVGQGECFYFEAEKEHYLENRWKRDAVILWVTSPPYF